MLEKDAGRSAHRKFAASSAIEAGLSQINDSETGRVARSGILTDRRSKGSPGDRSNGREGWVCSRGIVIVIVCRNVGKLGSGG
jgi:hypothetical protein